ncbi:MAG: alpha-glucosidase [Spirochaetaceae bacterium]
MSLHRNEETAWWKDAVVYQIYPRSFRDANGDGVGDLAGIREKADYLSFLGVDAVWLSPIYESPNADWGYDVSDYYAIDPIFGDLEEFDALLEELHRRGIRLIMDLVVNHTSTQHHWFKESLSDPRGPFGDFYIWKSGTETGPPNNWHSFFGGSAWEYRSERRQYYLHLFDLGQADLNWDNPDVRREVYRIMEWWLDRGIDGFRMDVINMISKDRRFPNDERVLDPSATRGTPYFVNGPKLHDYLRELRSNALSRPGIVAIGECPGATVEEVRQLANLDGRELDMVIQMELMELDHGPGGKWDIRSWKPEKLAGTIAYWQERLEEVAWPANFFSNHDQPRAVSRFGDDGMYRFESATMLAVLLISQSGTPFIYYGEEIGMPNADYVEIGHYLDVDSKNFYGLQTMAGREESEVMGTIRYMSRDNARSPMQWDEGPTAGFTSGTPWIPLGRRSSEISVESEERAERSVLREYRKLLRLRKAEPALRRGSFAVEDPGNSEIFAFRKLLGSEELLVLVNLTGEEATLAAGSSLADTLGAVGNPERVYGNFPERNTVQSLAPYEAVIYRLTGGEGRQ